MKKDEKVFLLGEEVAQYNGAYKVGSDTLILESLWSLIPNDTIHLLTWESIPQTYDILGFQRITG